MSKEKIAQVIPEYLNSILRGVHTAFPGKIDSYDRETYRADITPLLSHLTIKNREVEVKPIYDVPVLLTGGSAGVVDIELVKDDNVLVVVCEAGIGGWKSSDGKKQVSPDDLSHHMITNAIAIPCLVPDGQKDAYAKAARITIDKDKNIGFENEKVTASYGNDGAVLIDNGSGTFEMESGGKISLNGNLTVDP